MKCPCCGCNAGLPEADLPSARRAFTVGALGRYAPTVLTQHIVAGVKGTSWTRRPMSRQELEHVGRALVTAYETVRERLGQDVTPEAPEAVLASIEDDEEAARVREDWLREAEEELERRRQIVAFDELQRDAARRRYFDE